jgi:hypothetical protein
MKTEILNFLSKYLNKNKMAKQLVLSEHDALRLYPTADKTLKELLELNFGKEFFNQKITDRVKDYNDILSICGVNANDDEVSIKGFEKEENELVKNLIKKIRTCKVYREGWFPKRGDRRYYNWYNVSSGFVFHDTYYADTLASSASRLSFETDEKAKDFHKKFGYIDQAIIGIND